VRQTGSRAIHRYGGTLVSRLGCQGFLFNRAALSRPQKATKLDDNMTNASSGILLLKPAAAFLLAAMALLLAALALLVPVTTPARAQGAGAAAEVVADRLHAGLERLMAEGQTMGLADASDYIGGVVDETYNLKSLTAQSIGPSSFRGYDDAGRALVVAAYREFVIANYVSRFARPLPIRFKTLGTSEGPRGAVLVNTQLVRASGDPVDLDYIVVTPEDGRPGIADVLYNGVSEAARRRSELSSLARLGAAPLAEALTRKAETIAATPQ
jgi:phospholipid transport system substrate-binding protein